MTITIVSGVTSTGITLMSGDKLSALSGGIASNTLIEAGGFASALLSGSLVGTTIVGNATTAAGDFISSGGSALDTTISNGGFESVRRGGVATDTTVLSGGAQNIRAQGTAIGTTISDGGFASVTSNGSAFNAVVESGGFLVVSGGGSATSATVNSGGTEEVISGAVVSDSDIIVGGTINLVSVAFAAGGTATVDGSDLLTVSVGGQTYTQQLLGDYSSVTFTLADAGVGTDVIAAQQVCYVAGARILTEHGEVPVETLEVGQPVMTLAGGARSVRWIGRRTVDTGRHPRPWLVQPVRIRAHAFAPGLPRRDLLVSQGHAMFIDGRLIPACHLVNGATVLRDDSPAVITYFHVELDTHDILLAEGVPSESYIECGNRAFFANAEGAVPLHGTPDAGRVYDDGETPDGYCAPVCNGGPALAAARRVLHDRALTLGWKRRDEAGVHLLADGARIPASGRADRIYRFALPREVRDLWLVSSPGVPAETDPNHGDRRRLGVALTRLTWRGPRVASIDLHPADPRLIEGWHALERDDRGVPFRWTDGRGQLPGFRAGELLIEISQIRTGWAAPAATRDALLRAG